jgi:hypothetical protein
VPIQAARALRRSRGLKRDRRKFEVALAYLWKYREHVAYDKDKRHGLPIGRGVAEAAGKTTFTQRMKLSGMRWENTSGQTVLDLRVIPPRQTLGASADELAASRSPVCKLHFD